MTQNATLNWPDWVYEYVKKAHTRFPTDIDKGANWLYDQIANHADYESIIEKLVRSCLRGLIHEERHKFNTSVKKSAKAYTNTPNGDYAKAADSMYEMVLAYRIGAKMLGTVIIGEESDSLANQEENISRGHLFNAAVLRWLGNDPSNRTAIGKTVREGIPGKRLVRKWREFQKQFRMIRDNEDGLGDAAQVT